MWRLVGREREAARLEELLADRLGRLPAGRPSRWPRWRALPPRPWR